MAAARRWPPDKPLADPEQFVGRKFLEMTLKEMGRGWPGQAWKARP
jgi:hypothetical protein